MTEGRDNFKRDTGIDLIMDNAQNSAAVRGAAKTGGFPEAENTTFMDPAELDLFRQRLKTQG